MHFFNLYKSLSFWNQWADVSWILGPAFSLRKLLEEKLSECGRRKSIDEKPSKYGEWIFNSANFLWNDSCAVIRAKWWNLLLAGCIFYPGGPFLILYYSTSSEAIRGQSWERPLGEYSFFEQCKVLTRNGVIFVQPSFPAVESIRMYL